MERIVLTFGGAIRIIIVIVSRVKASVAASQEDAAPGDVRRCLTLDL